MYLWLLVIFFFYLTYTDVKFRRIPNKSLLIFCALSLGMGKRNILLACFAVFLFLMIRRLFNNQIGMGDVKLISTLSLGVPSVAELLMHVWIACVIAGCAILVRRIFFDKWWGTLPFAPFICLGFIVFA
jgi:Flp pilus assembly protein protease CpaA